MSPLMKTSASISRDKIPRPVRAPRSNLSRFRELEQKKVSPGKIQETGQQATETWYFACRNGEPFFLHARHAITVPRIVANPTTLPSMIAAISPFERSFFSCNVTEVVLSLWPLPVEVVNAVGGTAIVTVTSWSVVGGEISVLPSGPRSVVDLLEENDDSLKVDSKVVLAATFSPADEQYIENTASLGKISSLTTGEQRELAVLDIALTKLIEFAVFEQRQLAARLGVGCGQFLPVNVLNAWDKAEAIHRGRLV
ncbi:hypothetical protein B0O99DRAFT_726815 [Bisporella sp. PMI_857]|nr:hypothetical protein B0O99DRAFT_726815 [Bisporella sp. PMI_857]